MKKKTVLELVSVDAVVTALPKQRRKAITARGAELLAKVEKRRRAVNGERAAARERALPNV
jgi:hypothetical protein